MARSMARAGNPVAKGIQHAHHLVAKGARLAAPARDVLERVGVGIDDAENGAAADKAVHAVAHAYLYYRTVNKILL